MNRSERVALYEIPEVQALLKIFVSGNLKELLPEIHPILGARYPTVDEVAGDDQKARALLEQLVQAGILRAKFYEKSVICPSCHSKNVTFRYHCTHCGSHEIEKREMYEHIECETIDSDDRFMKNGRIACPRCGKPLSKLGVDYRKVGTWFGCRDCGKRFDAPEGKHYCRQCSSKFGVKESAMDDVYSYVLNNVVETEFARETLFLAELKKILQEAGYEAEAPAVITGASGESHNFDLVGFKTQPDGRRKTVVTLDMAFYARALAPENVTSVFAKTLDVSPIKSILIAVPALSDTAKKLVDLYKLEVIEGEKPEKISQEFREAIDKISDIS